MWTVLADAARAALDADAVGSQAGRRSGAPVPASSSARERQLVRRELGRVLPLAGQIGDAIRRTRRARRSFSTRSAPSTAREHGALLGRASLSGPRPEREPDRRRPPATRPAVDRCVARGPSSRSTNPNRSQLTQVVAARRRRGADDGRALGRGARRPGHQQLEDRRALRMGERPHRVEVGDDPPAGLRSRPHRATPRTVDTSEGNPSHLDD